MRRLLTLLSALYLSACTTPVLNQPLAGVVLTGATLIDGSGSPPVPNSVVVIQAGKILAAGPAESTPLPPNSQIIDLRGRWLIPGFVDSHVHFFETGRLFTNPPAPEDKATIPPDMLDYTDLVPYDQEAEWATKRVPVTLRSYLCAGVTSAISLGGPPFESTVKAYSAKIGGPNVFTSGEAITTLPPDRVLQTFLGGQSTGQASTELEGRMIVTKFADAGADAIKTGQLGLPGETNVGPMLRGAIAEAHKRGLKVYHHEFDLEEAKEAVRLGVDVLAHVVSSGGVDAEFLQLARTNKVTVVTTAGLRDRTLEMLTGNVTLSPIEQRCGDPEVISSWKLARKDLLSADIAKMHNVSQQWRENLRRMGEAGISIAVGSDAGVAGTLHGASFHREMLLLQEIGLSPGEIIVAATSAGARALGRDSEIGLLLPGRRADILVLTSNPLMDVRNAAAIEAVIKDGKWLDAETMAVQQ